MLRSTGSETRTIALLGNPNSGKSTLFNALVGVHQRVGNYPGVTVEKKTGVMESRGVRYEVIDLPGLYSLAPRSRDEAVAVEVLTGRRGHDRPVEAVICVVDACKLERHLYLVSQAMELGLPMVLAVNMIDVAERRGIRLDLARLESRLGIPVVATQANRRIGVEALRSALATRAGRPETTVMPAAFEREVDRLAAAWGRKFAGGSHAHFLARRLLLDVDGRFQGWLEADGAEGLAESLQAARDRLGAEGHAVPSVETQARYAWVRRLLEGVVSKSSEDRPTVTDRIDHLLTHRVGGTAIFVVVMLAVFQAVFVWAEPLMAAIDGGMTAVGRLIEAHMAPGAVRSLLVEGVLGGVGGVLAFLPQILILFAFIAVLEDCGYMARAALLMDKFMVRVGLSGKSFIPMLSSFACAIPGIMAARVIEDERDRLTTILIAPLLTCSARLPVYALLIAAFVPSRSYWGGLVNLQGLTLAALYALGIAAAVTAALVMKRAIFRGETPPFVMELPSYQWPSLRNVVYRVGERAFLFVRCAGTIILAVSVIVWAGLYYPHNAEVVEAPFRAQKQRLERQLAQQPPGSPAHAAALAERVELENRMTGAYQRQSILGRVGRAIEPVFRPLGWDWRISAAVIASFPAREVVVATLGVIFNLGEDVDLDRQEDLTRMTAQLHAARWEDSGRPLFNLPVALSLMVFYALCAQCVATLAVIRRETNSWRWPVVTFAYMTTLAYGGAWIVYQLGMVLAGGS